MNTSKAEKMNKVMEVIIGAKVDSEFSDNKNWKTCSEKLSREFDIEAKNRFESEKSCTGNLFFEIEKEINRRVEKLKLDDLVKRGVVDKNGIIGHDLSVSKILSEARCIMLNRLLEIYLEE